MNGLWARSITDGYAKYAAAGVCILMFVYYCDAIGFSAVEIVLFSVGSILLWLPLGGTIYALLRSGVPDFDCQIHHKRNSELQLNDACIFRIFSPEGADLFLPVARGRTRVRRSRAVSENTAIMAPGISARIELGFANHHQRKSDRHHPLQKAI